MAKKEIVIDLPKEGVAPTLILPPSLRPCPNLFRAVLVDDEASKKELQHAVGIATKLTVDTETTGLKVDRDKIIGVCLSFPPWETGYYVPMFNSPEGSTYWQSQATFDWWVAFFKEVLESPIHKTLHNMLYDAPIIYHNFNIVIRAMKTDTMLKSHVGDADSEHGLKELSVKKIHPEADWYEAEMKRCG